MRAPEDLGMLESLLNYSPDILCVIAPGGVLQRVSAAGLRALGYAHNELVGQPFTSILAPADRPAALAKCLQVQQQPEPVSFEGRCLGRAGQGVGLAWSAFRAGPGGLLLCVGRPAAGLASPAAPGQEVLHAVLIEHGFDMVALLDEQGYYTYVGGATLPALGYLPEELVGQNAFDLIHPDDLPRVQAYWNQLSAKAFSTIANFRFRAASGEWKWIESTVSNQLHNPAIRAYTVSSRDITERWQKSLALAESEQRFRLLFENNSTLGAFQTTEGHILDANPAFLSFFKKPKQQVLGRRLTDFLPHALRALFEQQFREAVAGRKVPFEATFEDQAGEARILSVRNLPLVVEGKTVGVHVMAKDITEMATAQRLIKRQAEELTTILESITDAFFSLDKNQNFTYLNRESERILQVSREKCLGRNLWDVLPKEANSIPYHRHQLALSSGNTVHFEPFLTSTNRWLDIKVFPSEEGLSVYFSDITDRIAADRQLERLALVAQGTDNGVIITDAQGLTEWVNEGFTKQTGYTLADMAGRKPGAVLQGPDTEPATVQHMQERMQQGQPCAVTILNYQKSGQKLWLSMDITPIYNDAGQLTQYIAIQQNITYRKEIEASQAKMAQDLYQQNRDLQQFTYVVSHNLRAPLANAIGLAKLLGRVDKNAASFDNSLALLSRSIGQVDTVLNDLNLVLSIRDKQDVQQQEPVVLAEVIQQAILHLQDALHQCGGQVRLDCAEGLVVPGNRAYLYSIFYNLLSNSIKYRAQDRRLEVEIKCACEEQGRPTIAFADNGSGFDRYKAGSDVFQLYKRFHTNQRGRGIGLFLVKAHVEAMGGKIEVVSGVNVGTRFLIHLDQH